MQDPAPRLARLVAEQLMASPVEGLPRVVPVAVARDLLRASRHHGFPVYDPAHGSGEVGGREGEAPCQAVCRRCRDAMHNAAHRRMACPPPTHPHVPPPPSMAGRQIPSRRLHHALPAGDAAGGARCLLRRGGCMQMVGLAAGPADSAGCLCFGAAGACLLSMLSMLSLWRRRPPPPLPQHTHTHKSTYRNLNPRSMGAICMPGPT